MSIRALFKQKVIRIQTEENLIIRLFVLFSFSNTYLCIIHTTYINVLQYLSSEIILL